VVKSLYKGIGTIIISIVIGVVPQVLVVKGMITQANANYWLIGAIALLLLGVYLVISGTVLKSKTTQLVSPTRKQSDIVQDAAKVQLDYAKALSDDYFRTRQANRIIRFILIGVGLCLVVWGVIDINQHSWSLVAGFVIILWGFMWT